MPDQLKFALYNILHGCLGVANVHTLIQSCIVPGGHALAWEAFTQCHAVLRANNY
jgi:hypothetical protein